jgi:DNA-binding transcriptional ArsR family regulator
MPHSAEPAGQAGTPLPPNLEELRAAMPSDNDVFDVADVFSLLGDPARVRILVALTSGRMRVHDIADVVGASDSSVSHALRLLRAHRVVTVHRVGREAHYELADSHVRALLALAMDHVGHSTLIHQVGETHSDATTCTPKDA